MSDPIYTLLLLLIALQTKHVIADYWLQSKYILENRSKYGHPGGLLHVAIHLVGTLLVLLVFGVSTTAILVVLTIEAVIHYHLDYMKDNVTKSRGWTPQDRGFWMAAGVDQFLHQITYVGFVWGLAASGAV